MPDQLTEAQVRHVAKLSRLRLSDAEIVAHARRLSAILDYVGKLSELNLEGVEPMAHAGDVTNVLREDEAKPGLDVDAVLANAPDSDPPFFKVPKVIGEGSGA